jgi:hypothetical protein
VGERRGGGEDLLRLKISNLARSLLRAIQPMVKKEKTRESGDGIGGRWEREEEEADLNQRPVEWRRRRDAGQPHQARHTRRSGAGEPVGGQRRGRN